MSHGVRLIVFGRQGAGKGTQCKLLADHYGVPHISTGDMLRAAVTEGTEFGLRAKEIMDAGALVSDEVMKGLVGERLTKPDAAHGWILDGFPRTPGQAADLADVAEPTFDLALNLEVPEDVVVERITARRVCESCGAIYSVGDPSADSGSCATCAGVVSQRADDTEDAVRNRLALYSEQTAPLLEWFAERGSLVQVDGVGDPRDIQAEVRRVIEDRLAGR